MWKPALLISAKKNTEFTSFGYEGVMNQTETL
jgi:hypothetical protein